MSFLLELPCNLGFSMQCLFRWSKSNPFEDMGTKLQPAIDLLATRRFLIASKIRGSMERTFKQRGVDAVKTTMLKQEEIFKQQVRELHRLYSLQRMLMEEVKREMIRQSKYSNTLTNSPRGCERSGSCSGGDSETRVNAKRSLGFDFDIVRAGGDHREDNSTGMSITVGPSSSCSTINPGSSRITGAGHAGLDLTLSIGGGDKKRLKDINQCIGLECSDARKMDQKTQELQLHPCLSTMRSSSGTQNLTVDKGEEERSH